MESLESTAREAIRDQVQARGWTLRKCVEQLAAVGHTTNTASVHRFLSDPSRRLGIDEFTAWALALSLPPLALLAPARGRMKRRTTMVREWVRGTAPLPEVPEPDRFVSASLHDRPANVPELTTELHRQADRYAMARGNVQAEIEAELFVYLANKQLADYAEGQARARQRHGKAEQD